MYDKPEFYGFLDKDECRVNLCFSPAAPRFDGVYATAYYTKPQVAVGEVVVTKNDAGHIVCVTRQDEDGRIISVIAVSQQLYRDDPECWAIYDAQGFYETRDTEEQCKIFCEHYNARDKRLGGGCGPYTYLPLYKRA